DQHVRSVLVDAEVFTAHDASDGFHTVVVSDHAHIGAEPVFPAVECQKRLAGNGPAHHEVALDLRRVEDMERASAVEGEIVGDVHQRVDRAQTNCLQPLLHPFWRGAVLHATHQADCTSAAEI